MTGTDQPDAAVVGTGAIHTKDHDTILKSVCIIRGEQLMAGRKGVVGDIPVCFFDAHGEIIPDIKIHNEFAGPELNSLSTIPVVTGTVAGGEQKAEVIITAMRGKYINTLVTKSGNCRENNSTY